MISTDDKSVHYCSQFSRHCWREVGAAISNQMRNCFRLANERGQECWRTAPLFECVGATEEKNRLRDRRQEPQLSILDIERPTQRGLRLPHGTYKRNYAKREHLTFSRVEFHLAHQEVGPALVEQVLNQTNGAPMDEYVHKAIKGGFPWN